MADANTKRRYPIGAEVIGEGRTHFRVWAPKAKRLDVVLESSLRLTRSAPSIPPAEDGAISPAPSRRTKARLPFGSTHAETFHRYRPSRFQPKECTDRRVSWIHRVQLDGPGVAG